MVTENKDITTDIAKGTIFDYKGSRSIRFFLANKLLAENDKLELRKSEASPFFLMHRIGDIYLNKIIWSKITEEKSNDPTKYLKTNKKEIKKELTAQAYPMIIEMLNQLTKVLKTEPVLLYNPKSSSYEIKTTEPIKSKEINDKIGLLIKDSNETSNMIEEIIDSNKSLINDKITEIETNWDGLKKNDLKPLITELSQLSNETIKNALQIIDALKTINSELKKIGE